MITIYFDDNCKKKGVYSRSHELFMMTSKVASRKKNPFQRCDLRCLAEVTLAVMGLDI